MPNYEIVHDQVGPFPRLVYVEKDGQQSVKTDDKGVPIPRVVSAAVINATSPEVKKAPGVNPYEGNLKFWLRAGAIKETDAALTEESVPPSILNNVEVPGSPAAAEMTPATKTAPSPVPSK